MPSHPPALHPWNVSPEEAARIQSELCQQLRLIWDGRPVHTIAGVDAGLAGDQARCAIVVLRFPDLTPLESAIGYAPLDFPYIPGLLAFREGPAVLEAWQALRILPDVVLFDGQGIAHPRRIGIASQMGLWLNRPTIGVAKSRLYGHHAPVPPEPGGRSDLFDEHDPARRIGVVLRTRRGTNPLYVSPGHLIDIEQAVTLTLACCVGYRLPEPIRWAHHIASGQPLPGARQERLFW